MRLFSRQLLIASVLGIASGAHAQSTVPGASGIDASRIRFGALEYVLSMTRAGEEEFVGTVRDEILPVRGDDPVIRRVQTVRRGRTVTIDSTVTDANTLAPRWHRSVEPDRDVLLTWSEGRVRGAVTGTAKGARSPKVIDAAFVDAFDSANWDLAVRALALDDGDGAVLDVYDAEHLRHSYGIQVVSRDLRGNSFIVHVTVQLGRNSQAHAWFDDVTRTLLRIETQISEDTVLRQVLKP